MTKTGEGPVNSQRALPAKADWVSGGQPQRLDCSVLVGLLQGSLYFKIGHRPGPGVCRQGKPNSCGVFERESSLHYLLSVSPLSQD
ncbi:hypothetical protein I7I48_02403 [Histoplasma ohiense]|nr:hypothetical protein I7I48_02403 [Histoplasma ohiense (nom. inval.)]